MLFFSCLTFTCVASCIWESGVRCQGTEKQFKETFRFQHEIDFYEFDELLEFVKKTVYLLFMHYLSKLILFALPLDDTLSTHLSRFNAALSLEEHWANTNR